MRTIEVLNPAGRGVSRCVKANYYKMGCQDFFYEDGPSATGVIEYEDCTTDKPDAGRSGEDAEG